MGKSFASTARIGLAAAYLLSFGSAIPEAKADNVSLFADPACVITSTGEEQSFLNLENSIATSNAFTGFTASDWSTAIVGADAILIPRGDVLSCTSPDPTLKDRLTIDAKAVIRDYVSSGGRLVVLGGGRSNVDLLNDVFRFSLVAPFSGDGPLDLNSADAQWTEFEGGPLTLTRATGGLDDNLDPWSLSAGTRRSCA